MSKPGVRLDDDVYEWLMDHRTSKKKTVSDVVRKLIQQVEGSVSGEMSDYLTENLTEEEILT